jgi:hypothetical protein
VVHFGPAIPSPAAALNPLGFKYLFVSALPATAGANALIIIPKWTRRLKQGNDSHLLVSRSIGLVGVGALLVALFISVFGRGISWNR